MSDEVVHPPTWKPGARVVVLTGAGISQESGIRTFRDGDGLWEEHRIEDVATPSAWRRDPELVWRFYQLRRAQLQEVAPNPAHHALRTLEDALADRLMIITQNVDDLHERAGSTRLIHMHGELRKLRCEWCGVVDVRMEPGHLIPTQYVPCVSCEHDRMRPHIVWFNEVPFGMDDILERTATCDIFVSIGTSGHVHPAAGLIDLAKRNGARCIGVNLEPPRNLAKYDEFHLGRAGEMLPDLIDAWIGNSM